MSTASEADDSRRSILQDEHSIEVKRLSFTDPISNQPTSNNDEDSNEKGIYKYFDCISDRMFLKISLI